MAIVREGRLIVSDAILTIECRLKGAPSYLHQATALQHYFIVEATFEHACRRSDGGERAHGFNIEVVPACENDVSVG